MPRNSYEGGCLPIAVASAAAIGVIAWALASQDPDYREQGTVHLGADGVEYVLPDNAQRPVYADKEDCVEDVTAQIQKIEKDTGSTVQEKPEDLCQPVSDYPRSTYPHSYFYGPVVNGNSAWQSGKVTKWETTIPDGTFNATSVPHQPGIKVAPKGSKVGQHTQIEDPNEGGFGEHGSGGFSKPGSGVRNGGLFGGGHGEEGGEHGGGFHGGFHGGE